MMIIIYVSNGYGLFGLLVGKENDSDIHDFRYDAWSKSSCIRLYRKVGISAEHVTAQDAEMLVFDCKNSPRY